MKKCGECEEIFQWDDTIVEVEGHLYREFYHEKCVQLYPTGYVAFTEDEFIGEVDHDLGTLAYDALDPGEYLEE